MRFNPKARLDRSQVEVRRGGGRGHRPSGPMGGVGRFPGGAGMKVGGGIGGLILVVVIVLLQTQLGGSGGSGGSGDASDGGSSASLTDCRSGSQANRNERCALVADVNSIQDFWARQLPKQAGVEYIDARTELFSGETQTGCGPASTDVGPFYCPVDKHVYLDQTFFNDMLQGRLGARGGPFSEAYVLAHEYGHHVQDLLGTMGRVHSRQGGTSDSVRLELQADCYAGIWAAHATSSDDASGQPLISNLTRDDVRRALDAAAAVGDDRIQRQSGGRVDPDSWTHGSAHERMRWFTTGMQEGTLRSCDTFAASRL
jgi:predicted metalloprotease